MESSIWGSLNGKSLSRRSLNGRSLNWGSLIWRSLVRRVGSKHKTLTVRETAALGDRRFVSVIQCERQRFLIGSSPSSITLLARLPDEFAGSDEGREVTGERN